MTLKDARDYLDYKQKRLEKDLEEQQEYYRKKFSETPQGATVSFFGLCDMAMRAYNEYLTETEKLKNIQTFLNILELQGDREVVNG